MSNNMLIFALSRSNQRMLRYVIQSRGFGGVDIALPKIIDRFRAWSRGRLSTIGSSSFCVWKTRQHL